MKQDCKHKKGKYCKLKEFEFKTENAEINICGYCKDYEKQNTN